MDYDSSGNGRMVPIDQESPILLPIPNLQRQNVLKALMTGTRNQWSNPVEMIEIGVIKATFGKLHPRQRQFRCPFSHS